MKRPIAIALSPNTSRRDIFTAFSLLVSPWSYQKGSNIRFLEQWFRRYFSVSHAIPFASGRAALYAVLRALEIREGDEVLLQAFTCVAVPNAVISVGAKPIYVDIDDSLTIDIQDLKKKISKKTKAIIVQHTFGIPSHIKEIMTIAKEYKIPVVEDVAHTIGTHVNGRKQLGTYGHAAIFSFGRDKAFSSVFGGMAITNNKIIGEKIRNIQTRLQFPSLFWVMQQLFHPVVFAFILPLYSFGKIGKGILILLQKMHAVSLPVTKSEKLGKTDRHFVAKMPNALASLALMQVKRLNSFNAHRQKIVEIYTEELSKGYTLPAIQSSPLLRFPVLVEDRDKILSYFRKHEMYLGNWYANVIDPQGVDFDKIYYSKGSCPKAEYVASRIINFPTYPAMKLSDARRVVTVFKDYAKN